MSIWSIYLFKLHMIFFCGTNFDFGAFFTLSHLAGCPLPLFLLFFVSPSFQNSFFKKVVFQKETKTNWGVGVIGVDWVIDVGQRLVPGPGFPATWSHKLTQWNGGQNSRQKRGFICKFLPMFSIFAPPPSPWIFPLPSVLLQKIVVFHIYFWPELCQHVLGLLHSFFPPPFLDIGLWNVWLRVSEGKPNLSAINMKLWRKKMSNPTFLGKGLSPIISAVLLWFSDGESQMNLEILLWKSLILDMAFPRNFCENISMKFSR